MSQNTEERIAHLERQIEDLSDTLAKQDKELMRLTKLVELLARREMDRDVDGGGGVILGDERPPHY